MSADGDIRELVDAWPTIRRCAQNDVARVGIPAGRADVLCAADKGLTRVIELDQHRALAAPAHLVGEPEPPTPPDDPMRFE